MMVFLVKKCVYGVSRVLKLQLSLPEPFSSLQQVLLCSDGATAPWYSFWTNYDDAAFLLLIPN